MENDATSLLAGLTGEETYPDLLKKLGVQTDTDLPPDALEIVRHRQIVRVLALMEDENLSIGKACKKVGINTQVFRRWLAQDDVVQAMHHLSKTAIIEATMTSVAALPEATAQVARIARGQIGEPRDHLAANSQLIQNIRLLMELVPEARPHEEDASFEPSFEPLSGPRTRKVTIEVDGMRITREEGATPVIEVQGVSPTILSDIGEAD